MAEYLDSGATGDARPQAKSKWKNSLPQSAALTSPADDLNRAIIRLLEQDGRLPFATIAAELGVSEGTVRNRVRWMKESGMLRIVAVADPMALDYKADAMLGIKVAPGISPERVAERLAGHSEVVYILLVSGRYDLLVEIVCDAREDFVQFLLDHCYSQTDIASIETMTGIAMYKNQFLLKRSVP